MKIIILFVFLFSVVYCDQWAVIVAGSTGYDNYRHQADACHAYQIHRSHGIPEDHIILFSYNDVVNDEMNPFPGQLFNQPGDNPPDVYDGCKVTYSGKDVTPENYMSVLTQDVDGLKERTGKSKPAFLNSTSEDNVFLTFFDHGNKYIIRFPDEIVMTADQLMETFDKMYEKKMYKKMVYYMEACYSGSMFSTLVNTKNIYVATAANVNENSYAAYCSEFDNVKGVLLDTCLGDLFAITWMEDADLNIKNETLFNQWRVIQNKVFMSQPHQYGSKAFIKDLIWDFIGNKVPDEKHEVQKANYPPKRVKSEDVRLFTLNNLLKSANTEEKREKIKKLIREEENFKKVIDNRFNRIIKSVSNDNSIYDKLMNKKDTELENRECYYNLINYYKSNCGGFREYGRKYYDVLINLCHYYKGNDNKIKPIIEESCKVYTL